MSNTRPPVSDPSTRWARRIARILSHTAGYRNDVDLAQLALDVKAAAVADGRQATDAIVVHLCRLHLDGSPLSPTLPARDPVLPAAPSSADPVQPPKSASMDPAVFPAVFPAMISTPPNRARHDRFHARFMHRISDPFEGFPTSPRHQLTR